MEKGISIMDIFIICYKGKYVGYVNSIHKAMGFAEKLLKDNNETLYEIRKRYNKNGYMEFALVQSKTSSVRIERVPGIS